MTGDKQPDLVSSLSEANMLKPVIVGARPDDHRYFKTSVRGSAVKDQVRDACRRSKVAPHDMSPAK